ncbi:undecaprenyl-phosphate galactose phosphotransferase WbaP [Pokkaliibacter sp. CJK22405]|uniref:undecaprenyl-phosphate galactose phosphotransferase WbaP n=1 Tax=Pokkaliibacter sp. CJK22405 TaxID=3384615 RepID=UPI003984EB1E
MNTTLTETPVTPKARTKRRSWLCRCALISSDLLALFSAFLISQSLSSMPTSYVTFARDGVIFLTLTVVCLILFLIKGHYQKRLPFWDELRQIIKAIVLVALLHAAFLVLLQLTPSRLGFISAWIFALALVPTMRLLCKSTLLHFGWWRYPTVIIGDGENAADTARALAGERMMGYDVTHFVSIDQPKQRYMNIRGKTLPVIQMSETPEEQFAGMDYPHIVVALERGGLDRIQHYVDRLNLFYPRLSIVPALRGLPLFGTDMHHFFSHEVIMLNVRNNLNPFLNRVIKRSFDIVVSILLLLLLSPLFAFVSMKIKKSGGTAIFAHSRVGRDGKVFPCLKFRSMVPNAQEVLEKLLEQDPEARAEWNKDFKLKNDPRVTPIGHFLRKTSLDELPQLWNVLRGEMSLVGPRPVIAEEVERYGEQAVYYLQAKPGMTGLWQVSGRSDIDYDSRVYLDAWYVKNWSLWTDIVILISTIKVVLHRDGAY